MVFCSAGESARMVCIIPEGQNYSAPVPPVLFSTLCFKIFLFVTSSHLCQLWLTEILVQTIG
jgi:hypothetical protein